MDINSDIERGKDVQESRQLKLYTDLKTIRDGQRESERKRELKRKNQSEREEDRQRQRKRARLKEENQEEQNKIISRFNHSVRA